MIEVTSKDLVFNLIYGQTGIHLNSYKHELSYPIPTDGEYNTKIVLKAKIGSGQYVEHTVRYDRLDISHFDDISILKNEATVLFDLLPAINLVSKFGVMVDVSMTAGLEDYVFMGLQQEDIVNLNLPELYAGEITTIPIMASSKSYLFIGMVGLRLTGT